MASVELPDFNDMMKLVEEISNLSKRKTLLDITVKVKEAEVTREMTTDEKYFVKGKPPTQAFIDNSWKYVGFNNETLKVREELVEVSANLELAKNKFQLYRIMIDIWRTESANERTVFE